MTGEVMLVIVVSSLMNTPIPTEAYASSPEKLAVIERISLKGVKFNVRRSHQSRACHQLSHTTVAASWIAARKFRAVLSYRVAIARNCLSLQKKFSMRLRAL